MTFFRKIIFLAALAIHAATAAPDYTFALEGKNGAVTDGDFAGKYLLVTFGYTSCPDVCPLTLYELSQAMKQLNHPDNVQVVFISIDSAFETPAQVARYVEYFNPAFVGLTGQHAQLQAVAQKYGATFGFRAENGTPVSPPDLPEKYSVYHSALVYLISPERTRLETFAYQVKPEKMAEVINRHVK